MNFLGWGGFFWGRTDGDVVLLTFPGNVKDDYILARVTAVHPDDKNLVRRVTVKFRRKNAREARLVCKSRMEEKIVDVRRLVLLEPAPRVSSNPSDTVPCAPTAPSYSSATST